ncbi:MULTISPECIES: hypothetical protein [Bacteria]|uniref:hypothetical protein n=1 Tax=Bacteria TaxID=2 RepID=UPI002E7B54ED|nr:hypothetical protein [Cetobacterium somerae]WVJ03058.1 hypothetical protein VSU16_15110 [Cetobacterium somerae]
MEKKPSEESILLIEATKGFVDKISSKYDILKVDDKLVLVTKDRNKGIELEKLFESYLDRSYKSNNGTSEDLFNKKI